MERSFRSRALFFVYMGRRRLIFLVIALALLSVEYRLINAFFGDNAANEETSKSSISGMLANEALKESEAVERTSLRGKEISTSRKDGTPRNVFIDLGANCGNSYLKIFDDKSDILAVGAGWEAFLWEANPDLINYFLTDLATDHNNNHAGYPQVTIVHAAATTQNGEMKFHLTAGQDNITDKSQFKGGGLCNKRGNNNPAGASTIFSQAKRAGKPVTVPSIDFSQWLQDLGLSKDNGDRLVLKIDIEGAEVDMLERMLSTENDFDAICLTEKLMIEWHAFIFRKGSELEKKHSDFQAKFDDKFEAKCGRKPGAKNWY